MEKTEKLQKKNDTQGFKGLGVASLCVAALFFVLAGVVLYLDYASYGVAIPFGYFLQFMYQTNAFSLMFIIAFLLFVMFVKRRREVYAKVCLWGMLIFSLLYVAGFIGGLYLLGDMTFADGFDFIAMYAPVLCLVVPLVALLAQWEAADKQRVNLITLACAVISLFMAAYFCMRGIYHSTGAEMGSMQAIQNVMVMVRAAAATLVTFCLYAMTRSRRVFDKVIYAMTDEEAELVEGVEDKVETVVAEFEEEMLDEIARQIDEADAKQAGAAEAAVTLAENEEAMEEAADGQIINEEEK